MSEFKPNPKIEQAWEDWAEEVLENGKLENVICMYEYGWNWCFIFENGMQRYCKNAPEHIQRKLGVSESYIVHDYELPPNCYWGKKAKAEGRMD